jgi:hypothetical protein
LESITDEGTDGHNGHGGMYVLPPEHVTDSAAGNAEERTTSESIDEPHLSRVSSYDLGSLRCMGTYRQHSRGVMPDSGRNEPNDKHGP